MDGTASLTGDIRIEAPIMIDTTRFANLLLVTGGSVSQSVGATITKFIPTSPPSTPLPLSLGVIAGGSVTLGDANQVDTVAGFVDGGTNAFVFRNNSTPLTVGALPRPTIGVAFAATTGVATAAPIGSGPLASPLSGVTTAGGALTVATTGTTTPGLGLEVDSSISSQGGPITLMAGGIGGTFSNFDAIDSTSAATAGNIVILGDAISLASGRIAGTINAGTSGTVLLGPVSATNAIAIGAAGSSRTLGLLPADLSTVTAGMLQIGYRNEDGTPSLTGDINIAAPITLDTTKVSTLLLVTGGGVAEATGAFVNSTGRAARSRGHRRRLGVDGPDERGWHFGRIRRWSCAK